MIVINRRATATVIVCSLLAFAAGMSVATIIFS